MDTDPQVPGDEAPAHLLTYGSVNTTTQTYTSRDTACCCSPLQRPSKHSTCSVSNAFCNTCSHKGNHISNQRAIRHSAFISSQPLHPASLSSVFMSPPSSCSYLSSPLPDDKTTLLSSDKEMSPWRGVEGHTRSLSLLATLLKNCLSQTLTLNFPTVLPLSLTHS